MNFRDILKLKRKDRYVRSFRRIHTQKSYILDARAQNPPGKTIGKLSIGDSGNPIFVIGHHRLEGKFETLKRPFALLRKSSKCDGDGVEFDVATVVKEKIVFKNRPRPLVSSNDGRNNAATKKRRVL